MSSTTSPPPPKEFTDAVNYVKSFDDYPDVEPSAWALGYVTKQDGIITDVFFPPPYGNVISNYGSFALLWKASYLVGDTRYVDPDKLENDVLPRFAWTKDEPYNKDAHANVAAMEYVLDVVKNATLGYGRTLAPVLVSIDDLDAMPTFGMLEARLRLTLVSGGHLTLDKINLKKIFTQLKRTAWTNHGVFNGSKSALAAIRRKMQSEGKSLVIDVLDKFPMLVDYIDLDDSIRVLGRVRLGAYLGNGTTVMASGFVNFGAYVTGPNMIEGRVPIGSTIGAFTDVGGGTSIMGTTSGGNPVVVNIGEYCLLEAMSGVGFPIGDRVRVEAGFYAKSTTPLRVKLYDPAWDGNELIEALRLEHPLHPAGEGPTPFDGTLKTKAITFAEVNDAILRRDADTGQPFVVPRGDSTWGELDMVLHTD